MATANQDIPSKRLSLAEAFAGLSDPRVAGRSKHDLVEMLVVTVCVTVGHSHVRSLCFVQ
jgi:hypothetical protein